MIIIGKSQIAGGGGTAKRLEFEYTGTYNERADEVIELLSTGVFTAKANMALDLFLVGGGGSGSPGRQTTGAGGGGGGGGYTTTYTNVPVSKGETVDVTIGAGGASGAYNTSGNDGGTTRFGAKSANGGKCGVAPLSTGMTSGGAGGSGGGNGTMYKNGWSGGTSGGTNGSNGTASQGVAAGTGQGTTTREFGETVGKVYSDGGGGGGASNNTNPGQGGGENGGTGASASSAATSGTANTGSGGGGGLTTGDAMYQNYMKSGAGGSGIVCIRLHKE